jgi:hypothetical protein
MVRHIVAWNYADGFTMLLKIKNLWTDRIKWLRIKCIRL